LEARRSRFTAADLLRMLSALAELEPRFRKSGQQQLLLETLLVRFALLDRSVEIEDVLKSLGGQAAGGRRPASEAPAPPTPAEPNDIYVRAVMDARGDVAAILREWFVGVDRVQLRRDESAAPAVPPKRLTDDMVRAERLAALKKRDPVLAAAIDALDLEVVD